jgi:hypothetical protein
MAKGVSSSASSEYILVPYLSFTRLDVATRDFKRLRRLRRRESDQLLHWLAWIASRASQSRDDES